MAKSLNALRDEVHEWACDKGWWTNPSPSPDIRSNDKTWRNVPEVLMLVVSELSEALEDYRSGKMITWGDSSEAIQKPGGGIVPKPCGFPSEIADTFIRLLDICGAYGIDIEQEIATKMEYNALRAHRHGGKYA